MKPLFVGPALRTYQVVATGFPLAVAALPAWRHVLLPAMIGVHAVAAVPAAIPNCELFGRVVRTFRTGLREVWLTIDDGPHPEDTPRILDLLDEFRAKATFFVIGERARRYPHELRRIAARGHEVANHSNSHPEGWFWALPPAIVAREIDAGSKVIADITGSAPPYFRAPVGAANLFVHSEVRRRKLRLIGWSARGYDAVCRDPDRVVQRIMRTVRPGGIVLLHEGRRDRDGRAVNVFAIEGLLRRLSAAGLGTTLPCPEQLG
jgi:peptidoglycan/xylan/chitin deacetylase (PgdA/CDA1 family)